MDSFFNVTNYGMAHAGAMFLAIYFTASAIIKILSVIIRQQNGDFTLSFMVVAALWSIYFNL